MDAANAQKPSDRFTSLSDRFRSLWTFYQFLGGVFKHIEDGSLPYKYDFQTLYRRLQELVPRMDLELSAEQLRELDRVERELAKIHEQLSQIESQYPPSVLRRFFDHLKRQDEKILFALVKFYLMSDQLGQDALDKLDILLTRLAEAPLDDGRVLSRDPQDLRTTFQRLAEYGNVPPVPASEERPLVEAVREFRAEIANIGDFQTLLNSQVFDRYRKLKQRLGRAFLHPPILVDIISCNIEAKNRFRALYQEEEVRILEDTNRILEIERYVEKNPDFAHEELRRQIDVFRQSRQRFDSGRREGNLKREDILQMRQALHGVLAEFDRSGTTTHEPAPTAVPPAEEIIPDPFGEPPLAEPTPIPEARPTKPTAPVATRVVETPRQAAPPATADRPAEDRIVVAELFPPDPLLDASLHKLFFALDLVGWDHSTEQLSKAKELHHLRLEEWEVLAYPALAESRMIPGSQQWELQRFFLAAAALRFKMEEELEEIGRLVAAKRQNLLAAALENSAQSLERARDTQRRFQWFIDDMMYRGDTSGLEHVYRSKFRFMKAFSELWLEHQTNGGLTPL